MEDPNCLSTEMENPQIIYDVKISIRSNLKLLETIKDKLLPFPNRLSIFKNSVFGRWLDIKINPNDDLVLNYVLQHQVVVDKPSPDCPPIRFKIGDSELQFGRYEFCLVTGFRFGETTIEAKKVSPFCKRLFPEKKNNHIKSKELLGVIKNASIWSKLDDLDAVRVCLLLMEEVVFMGREDFLNIPDEIMTLVEDLFMWNTYPWGEMMWTTFYKKTVNMVPNHVKRHIKMNGPEKLNMGTYNLNGFVLAFKTWILESYPRSIQWWTKERGIIPRSQAWSNNITFQKKIYPLLFGQDSIPILELMPTEQELREQWLRRSLLFIKGEDAPFIQSIRPVVDVPVMPKVMSSGPRKILDDYDSLFKEVVHVRPDFTAAVVELRNKLVTQFAVETSPTGKDKATTSKKSNYEEFVRENGYHDTQGSLQDLVKILEPEFPPDISSIKTVREEIPETENVDLKSMKTEEEEQMEVPDQVKENFEIEDFMDFKNEGNFCLDDMSVDYEEENMELPDKKIEADKITKPVNLMGENIEEEHINVPSNNEKPVDLNKKFEADQVTTPVNLNGENIEEEHIIVPPNNENPKTKVDLDVFIGDLEVDKKMDAPIKSKLQELVERKKLSQGKTLRVKTMSKKLRKKKPGPQKQSPYVQQDPTTPLPAKKQRTSNKNLEPVKFPPLTTCLDGVAEENLTDIQGTPEKLLPFVENLSRPKKNDRVIVPPDVRDWLQKVNSGLKDKMFQFPWDKYGVVIDEQFFIALLGLNYGHRKGWLSSTHIETWIQMLFEFREQDADWSVAGPYFCPSVLCGSMGIEHTLEKMYRATWIDVEKVYFPLNEPDTHWALAELHLQTGVITVYDSMTPRKRNIDEPIAENRLWWREMRVTMSEKLPLLIDSLGVLKKRGLNVADYKITFQFSEKVPHQGNYYGDCGIWVCLILYRLVNKIPLVFGQPLQVALAYREQMVAYYWKYKVRYILTSTEDDNSEDDNNQDDM